MPASIASPLRVRNITQALVWMLASVMVPLLLGALALLVVQSRQERALQQNHLSALAQSLVQAVDGELNYGRGQLEVIAEAAVIDARDWQKLHGFASNVVGPRPGSLIALVGPDGQILLNTAVPWGDPLANLWEVAQENREVLWEGRPLPVSSQGMTRQVFELGEAAYSDLYYGVQIGRPTLALSVPVKRKGRVLYALTLALPPALLEHLISSAVTAPDLRVIVVDRRGIVVASNAASTLRLGDRAPPLAIAPGSSSGQYQSAGGDGARLLGAYAVSANNGFVVRVAQARQSTFLLPARATSVAWVVLALGALTASVLLAVLMGRRLAQPLRHLAHSAQTREPPPAGASGVAEIDALAGALRAGAQAERQRTEEHVLRIVAQQQVEALRDLERSEARAVESARRFDAEHRMLQATLQAAPVGIAVADPQGRFLQINQAGADLLGIAGAADLNLAGRSLRGWKHARDSQEAVPLPPQQWPLQRALAERRAVTSIIDIAPADGAVRRRTVLMSAAPVFDAAGDPLAGVVVQVDITKRVQAEAALRRADRLKDEFLATLAHELRNPLAPIRTAVELIRRRDPADATVQRAQVIIERQVLHLSRLVDDLLDVSRITLGAIQLRPETLDLGAVAASAIESVRATLEAAGLTLEQQIGQPPALVRGDATRLAQCIVNLLNNAAKFTPRGGRIVLRLAQEGPMAVIEVMDNGIGIAPENLERIFELFAQAQPSGFGGNTGLGIGLALTRKLVELHGGTVRAASAGPGQGSTFRIELPVIGAAAAGPRPQAPQGLEGAGARVLVVDDNHDAADTLGEMLAMSGFSIDVAYSGEAAVRAVEQDAPDAVLLDIGLPDIDGYEVCGRIRRSGVSRQPILIALTGWGQDQDRDRATAAGFNGHLTKPAEPDRVVALLKELLG